MIKLSSAFKFTYLTVFLLLLSAAVNAQAVITGTVKDESGNALTGASVSVQGASNGTTTDNGGTYTLRIKGGTHTI